MRTTAIVLAGGSGSRMGTDVRKQYLDLDGHTVLWHSLRAFEESDVNDIILVCPADDLIELTDIYYPEISKISQFVPGGEERYNSVYNGLCAVCGSDHVLIHDGARPFVDGETIYRCLKELESGTPACVAAVPSKDTVKIADENGMVISTPDRRSVWNIQTPQCFEYDLIYKAYSELISRESAGTLGDLNITDDAMVVEHFAGTPVKLVMGSYNNIKITTPEDLPLAHAILAGKNRL